MPRKGKYDNEFKVQALKLRMKVELFYDRYDTRKMTKEELKKFI